ncbi:hypothetical protein [Nonomuraea sp. NPDC048916]|uniref:hypothetical protein n=1 Tax=Nonomuraea sp. NPDC048916 TaxID=3154232 RepID=UPI0033EBE751
MAAALRLLLSCDVTVLVICPDRGVAAHYARPIDSGLTGYRLQGRVLGPDDIPAITDPHQAAAHLQLSAMAVMVHGGDRKVVEAFAMALAELRDDVLRPSATAAPEVFRPRVSRVEEGGHGDG